MYHRIFLFPWQPNFVFIADLIYVYIQSGEYVTTVIWLKRGMCTRSPRHRGEAAAGSGSVALLASVWQFMYSCREWNVSDVCGGGGGGGGHHVSWLRIHA